MKKLLRSPALPWCLLFLVFGTWTAQLGGTNAVARIAGLRAIAEGGTLHIDRYQDWSNDWALSPNGHYYPNKAPGGVLLGLPVFALLDFPARALDHSPRDTLGRATPPGWLEVTLLCLLTQLLPFALLVAWACVELEEELGDARAAHFFALAALFGNTAALYMGSYFGHGLAAWLLLAGFLAWYRARYGLAAAFVAASMLTDYGAAGVVPFFVAATLWRERSARPLARIALGGAPFAALWLGYHVAAFGGPFALAIRFANPAQIEAVAEGGVWGMMGFLPRPDTIAKLVFGWERGILVTQPWLLAFLPALFLPVRFPRGTALFLGGGAATLLWMNGSIAAWHGGLALGPRYLCVIFPTAALALALAWRHLPRTWHLFLGLTLAVSLAFRLLTLPFSILPPLENLWAYHLYLYSVPPGGTQPLRDLVISLAGFAIAAAWVRARSAD